MAVVFVGSGLTIEKLERIARHGEKVEVDPGALERIRACRAMLEDKVRAHEIMYGVNTGIGEFSEVVLNDEQVEQFQRYLIYNHAAGIGDPVPVESVRAGWHLFAEVVEEELHSLPKTMEQHIERVSKSLGF